MSGRTLWIWEHLPQDVENGSSDKSWLNEGDAVENINRLQISGHQPGTFSMINSGVRFPQTIQHDLDALDLIGKLAEPGAKIKIVQVVGAAKGLNASSKLVTQMKLAGMVNVQEPKKLNTLNNDQMTSIQKTLSLAETDPFEIVEVDCNSPNFINGSSKPLSFAQKIKKSEKKVEKKVWSLADMDDEDVDLIDEDDLLDEEDMAKPDQATLRVCGTTGKRKACKGCSCGLAEEISGGGEVTKKSVTSSCGSCYLGDAFRCASCPYLGMPAFKPGDKIQLSQRQLKADQ